MCAAVPHSLKGEDSHNLYVVCFEAEQAQSVLQGADCSGFHPPICMCILGYCIKMLDRNAKIRINSKNEHKTYVLK